MAMSSSSPTRHDLILSQLEGGWEAGQHWQSSSVNGQVVNDLGFTGRVVPAAETVQVSLRRARAAVEHRSPMACACSNSLRVLSRLDLALGLSANP